MSSLPMATVELLQSALADVIIFLGLSERDIGNGINVEFLVIDIRVQPTIRFIESCPTERRVRSLSTFVVFDFKLAVEFSDRLT